MSRQIILLIFLSLLMLSCKKNNQTQDEDSSSWIQCSIIDTNTSFNCLAYNKNSGFLFAGTTNGIAVSSDGGHSWKFRNSGLSTERNITAITTINNRIVSATHETVYYSDNDGVQWHEINDALHDVVQFNYDSSSQRIYASGSGLSYSEDNAMSWNTTPDISYGAVYGVFVRNNLVICEQWVFEWIDPYTIYIHQYLKRSTNFGETFSTVDNISLMGIVSFDSLMFGSTEWEYLYRSRDNGVTWESDSAVGIIGMKAIYSINPSYIFLGGVEDVIYLSKDKGQSWTNITANFHGTAKVFLQVGQQIYVSTGASVWKRNWTKL